MRRRNAERKPIVVSGATRKFAWNALSELRYFIQLNRAIVYFSLDINKRRK
jgi:hypothetical protein